MESNQVVFSKNVVEFVTVGVEYCRLLEQAIEYSRTEFVDRCVKLLPLLYLKATLLPDSVAENEEPAEEFVTEEAYGMIANTVASILGSKDDYLVTFHPEMKFSDTAVIANISEDLADIYQDIKNFTMVYSIGYEPSMNDALLTCKENFAAFWGQKLANGLAALHNLRFNEDELEDETDSEKEGQSDWFGHNQWESDDIDQELKNWE
jgi:hypothetical protein